MIQFICYPKCTTCQKAQKWLHENQIEYAFRDIKLDRPTSEELELWYKKSGINPRCFHYSSFRFEISDIQRDEFIS